VDKDIEQIHEEALQEIKKASTPEKIQSLSVYYLGRKGLITQFLRNISNLPKDQRPTAGKRTNQVKISLEAAIRNALEEFEREEAFSSGGIDVSLPGRKPVQGTLHPITQVMWEICNIFGRMGFDIAESPQIETDYYNFEALNIPKHHPARDMQDTFYISDNIVLRTHTSPSQPRFMEKQAPPVRIISPGKVYRCDSDLTHTPMFHQIEGLMVDKNVSFGDLKGILTTFLHQMFGKNTELRLRPSFFPFTEPSAEVDIRCVICAGKGCRVCSHTGWLEIMGAGMVHPAVFENVGYDTTRYSGFAFGMGIERIAMLKYGIDDIRKYFENDLRFLRQF
jgi:phenylalanyl-tRNA synthetase alpha chain